jgi:hypothetical protein
MNSDSPQINSTEHAAHPEGAAPSMIEQAARASWLGPLVALVLLVLTWKMPRGTGSVVIAVINGALLLAGLCLGIVALASQKPPRVKRIDTQAGVGVGLSLLLLIVIVWSAFFTTSPQIARPTSGPSTAPGAGVAQRPLDPVLDYPGWIGSAADSRAGLLLISAPDEAPATREFKAKFSKDFTALMLSIDTSQAPFDVYVDTRRASAHFADGQTVAALPIQELLESAVTDRAALIAEWMPPRQCMAHAGTVTNMLIPLPPNTYLKNMDRVSINVNGLPVDIRGQYLTVEEKAQRMRRNEPAGQPR